MAFDTTDWRLGMRTIFGLGTNKRSNKRQKEETILTMPGLLVMGAATRAAVWARWYKDAVCHTFTSNSNSYHQMIINETTWENEKPKNERLGIGCKIREGERERSDQWRKTGVLPACRRDPGAWRHARRTFLAPEQLLLLIRQSQSWVS